MREALVEELELLGAPAQDEIHRLLQSESSQTVRSAVVTLAEWSPDSLAEELRLPLDHTDPLVRREAVLALGKVDAEKRERVRNVLLQRLDDPHPEVRGAAATSIGRLGLTEAQGALMDRLHRSESEAVRVQALGALGRIRSSNAAPHIRKLAKGSLLSRPSPAVRIAACEALAAIDLRGARPVLEAATSDESRRVREAAQELLDGMPGAGMTDILLAEDNDDHALLIEMALERVLKGSVEVRRARDGDEAVAMVRDRPPDLLLLDLNMPGRSGHEVLEVVKGSFDLRRVPVAVLTSSDRPEDVAESYGLGGNHFLTKPGNPSELDEQLRLLLKNLGELGAIGRGVRDVRATGESVEGSESYTLRRTLLPIALFLVVIAGLVALAYLAGLISF